MRTHFYKFIFIVISLCAFATTNAWAKYVYIDVTKLLEADAPITDDGGYNYVTGKYYVHNMRIHAGSQKIELDSTKLLTIYKRRLYKVNIPDDAESWKISTVQSANKSTYIFDHPTGNASIQYQTDKTYNNKYIIKQVQWDGTNNAGEVVHMIGIVTGGLIYFDNSKTNWSAPIQMVIGHGSYARTYNLKQIDGTALWYVNLDKKDAEWADATYFAFINTEKAHVLEKTTPEDAVLIDGVSNTDIYRTPTELFKGSKYIFKPDSAKEKTTMTCTQAAPTKFDITQKVKIRDYEGANYQEITSNFPATFTLTTHTLNTGDTTAVAETKTGTSTLISQSVYKGRTTFSFSYTNPNETNFKFDAWGTGGPSASATNTSYANNYDKATTMYAFFTRKYAFSFSAQTGGTMTAKVGTTTLSSGTRVAGDTITLTASPNNGYEFSKWVDANGTELSTSTTYNHILKADITIKAVFAPIDYTITYETQGGNSIANKTYTIETATFDLPTPTRTGYTFEGWYSNSNFSGTKQTQITQGSTGNKTYYAKWTANTYTVIFNKNANDATGTMSNQSHTYGGSKALTANAFTRTGYTFAGWATTANGSKAYDDKASVSNLSSTNNATITLYAKWTAKQYNITLNPNNGSENTVVKATYNSSTLSATITNPTKTGYTFAGWYTNNSNGNGTGTLVIGVDGKLKANVSGYTDANGKWIKDGAKTLHAQWSPNTNTAYTVNHYQQNVDDSYPTTPTETQNLTGTTATSVSPAVKSYTGFTAPSTQTVTIAADGSTVVNYQYTRNSYALTWNLDGGTISSAGTAAGAVKYGATLTPPTVTRVGYTFDGWSPSVPATMPADHSTYTAQWNFAMEYEVTGSALITSANGKTVKATNTLTLQVSNMPVGTTVAISAPNITFYNEAGNVVTTLTTTSNPQSIPLTLAYTPTADNTTEQPTITLDVLNHKKTFANLISCRSLPDKFVIATKVGANWYALPANMNGATNPEGVLIEVNETNMTATAPLTTTYTLFPVKTTSGSADRFATYGDRVRFSAANNEYKGLWTSSSESTISNYAVIDDVTDGSSDASYEWKITTTIANGKWQYTLQTGQPNNQKYLRYWTAAAGAPKWGTYANGQNTLYFLPVTETTPFDYQVVEWYPTKMLIQTEAPIASPTAKIASTTINNLTCANKGGKLYEISGLPLHNNPSKVLTISYGTYSCSKVIPIIISRAETTVANVAPFSTLTNAVYNHIDLVVRDGATLTIDGTQDANTFYDVTIYPTAKITVPEGKRLAVHSLTFFGGIDEIYNGSTYTLNKYGVPELSLKGTLKKSISTIDYLMRVDLDQMYSLAVPYDVQLADIKYWDGSDIELGNALYISAYNGESRAQNRGNGNNWIYETDFASKLGAATLKAGVGYTISAELQSGVGASYSILRLPMTSNLANEASETAKQVAVTAHGIDAQVSDNHKGWNLVGNPYMASIKGADDDDLVLGYLQETGTGPWEWVEKTYRYVTIPSDNGEWYEQKKFAEATLPPFKNFFVQIGTTGDLQFGLGTRQSMPARYLQQEQAPREVEFELLLSNEAQSDNMGLLISEEYTPAYEINADLEKMIGNMSIYTIYNGYNLAFNALNPTNAEEQIPMGYVVPATGEYTFELNERGDFDEIEHIYLLDHDMNITTDLMEDIYTFAATEKKSDKRFAISVILKAEEEVETPTQLETLEWESDHPYKFIYQDKMYIMQNGVIYDAMGKQVQTINK